MTADCFPSSKRHIDCVSVTSSLLESRKYEEEVVIIKTFYL